jgi:hypothetical protein
MRRRAGQTLVSVALLLPLVLLPVVAYAVQATLLATRASALHASVAMAAEDATAALDVTALRATGIIRLDPVAAASIAKMTLAAEDPQAQLDAVAAGGSTVTVTAHDRVGPGFGGFLGTGAVTLIATSTAGLTAGYGRPSSRLPLPKRSLSITG